MTDSGSERVREFSLTQYLAPYLLLLIGNAGVQNASERGGSVLFWAFTAIAALGAASAVVRLRGMWKTHQRRSLPTWARFLGLLLALLGLYVVYCVIDGMADRRLTLTTDARATRVLAG
ncbi:hypothetical protein [Streptomyces sp. NPDC058739]|uniref:hypothetical protein n=1 Tax=Streptomyces sp. NPDC058739 TaxID=3346618 RepID=UPI0036A17F21